MLEEDFYPAQDSPTQTAHQVRKISFGELKHNCSAFETLAEFELVTTKTFHLLANQIKPLF